MQGLDWLGSLLLLLFFSIQYHIRNFSLTKAPFEKELTTAQCDSSALDAHCQADPITVT